MSHVICACDNPLCGEKLDSKSFDRCNLEAVIVLIDKSNDEKKSFCLHCAGSRLKTGKFIEEM